MKKLSWWMAAFVFIGCAAEQTALPEAQAQAANLYRARCGCCHSVPSPKRYYYDRWVRLVDVMNELSVKRGMPALASAEQETILAYLRRNAR